MDRLCAEITRLRNIWQSEREVAAWCCVEIQADQLFCLKSLQREEAKQASNSEETNGRKRKDGRHWIPFFSQCRRGSLTLAPEVALTNRYEALGMEGEESVNVHSETERNSHVKMI